MFNLKRYFYSAPEEPPEPPEPKEPPEPEPKEPPKEPPELHFFSAAAMNNIRVALIALSTWNVADMKKLAVKFVALYVMIRAASMYGH